MKYEIKSLLAQRELKNAGFYKGALDGFWGEVSTQAAQAWMMTQKPHWSELPPDGDDRTAELPEFDTRTELNIATLVPAAQFAARKFMRAVLPAMALHGLTVKIICGTRTYAEQDALYAQGRSTKGPIVTNASGGYSNHNFGLSWDILFFDANGQPVWESPHYHECALIGEAQGLDVGAFWKSLKDEPHYGIKTGLTLAQMRARKANGEPIV